MEFTILISNIILSMREYQKENNIKNNVYQMLNTYMIVLK